MKKYETYKNKYENREKSEKIKIMVTSLNFSRKK